MNQIISNAGEAKPNTTPRKQSQLSLAELLGTFAVVAGVLGLLPYVGLFIALMVGAALSLLIAIISDRVYWLIVAAVQFLLYPLIFGYAFFEVARGSSYVQNYNYRLEALAQQAQLVGAPEEMVEETLGKASFVWKRWDRTSMKTGEPTPDAKFRTTYNYAPYPIFPFQKFQVHCEGGIVRSTEMFDD